MAAINKVLSVRELNRASLARQMLLERSDLPLMDALEHMIGLQAQAPQAPYYALWTRLQNFQPEECSQAILDRKVVRIALMRSTLHLVTAQDALHLRPWLNDYLQHSLKYGFGKDLKDVDLQALAATGRKLIEQEPMTFQQLGNQLADEWPHVPTKAATAVVRSLVPLVQLPPRGLWDKSGQAVHATLESWLARPLAPVHAERIVRRYLAAFGPATVNDIQKWSGLSRLSEVVDRLRPELVIFRDEQGHELLDLPDAPRPDADTPAAPRYLGEFDNMLLSYNDRSRIISEADFSRIYTINGIIRPTFLIDGFVAGTWKLTTKKKSALLDIQPFRPLSKEDQDALVAEGTQLLTFASADASSREIAIQEPVS